MAHPDEILDTDFDAQLRGLFQQAERAMESRAGKRPDETVATTVEAESSEVTTPNSQSGEQPAGKGAQLTLPLLQPVVNGLAALNRTASESNAMLKKMEASGAATTEAQTVLPQLAAELRSLIESRNSVSQGMFAALHDELKGYKDGFLLDTVHRPIIRDIISLYDDTAEVHRQLTEAIKEVLKADQLCEAALIMAERMQNLELNLEHHLDFITEVLNRLDVVLMPPHTGKLNKRTQRAVAVLPAESAEADADVAQSVKRGFMWKDRVFRAEEVVVKRWRPESHPHPGSEPRE